MATTELKCDQPGCDYTTDRPQSLGVHKRHKHGIVGTSATTNKTQKRGKRPEKKTEQPETVAETNGNLPVFDPVAILHDDLGRVREWLDEANGILNERDRLDARTRDLHERLPVV